MARLAVIVCSIGSERTEEFRHRIVRVPFAHPFQVHPARGCGLTSHYFASIFLPHDNGEFQSWQRNADSRNGRGLGTSAWASGKTRPGGGALRIAVIGGGCSGLQYKMDLVDGPRDRDILVPSNGVNVVIDPKSALFVTGSELDWSDDLQQGGFKVSNPNALVTCSCGESFAA